MENLINENLIFGIDPPITRKPHENYIVRNGIKLDYELNLLQIGDIIMSNDREYIVREGGFWERIDK